MQLQAAPRQAAAYLTAVRTMGHRLRTQNLKAQYLIDGSLWAPWLWHSCFAIWTRCFHLPSFFQACLTIIAQAAFLSIRSFSCLTFVTAQYVAYLQVNMSVAVIPMAADLGWSPSDRGLVNSAFFWGYSLTQIPAGWVSTRSASLQAPLQAPHLLLPGS